MLPLAAVALFVVIGLADAISWIGTGSPDAGGNTLALNRPRSLIDRAFPSDFREASYSAPLADLEFYGGNALRHPGSHLLGTDILGRDVLHQTLKGVRIALLIGGLTSLLVIPIALLFGISAGYFGPKSSGTGLAASTAYRVDVYSSSDSRARAGIGGDSCRKPAHTRRPPVPRSLHH